MTDNSEYQLFLKLNLAQRVLMKSVDRDLRDKFGTGATQIAALLYLDQNNGCLLVDLSRELLQNKSAITTLVERMERNNLLQKIPSPTDKRATQLFISCKGKFMIKQAIPYVASYNQDIVKAFKSNELETVTRFLDTIIDKFETEPNNFFNNQVDLHTNERGR
ncbi:MAG: MarR family transcriptional regulator [Desulforhopalus sp.]